MRIVFEIIIFYLVEILISNKKKAFFKFYNETELTLVALSKNIFVRGRKGNVLYYPYGQS